MNAHAETFEKSPGLWRLAWRRLLRDRLGMLCLAVVAAFLLVTLASWAGLVAGGWNKEVGVSYASPTFMGQQENLEAASSQALAGGAAAPPVAADLRAIDPLADIYDELEARTRAIKSTETPKAETLPFGGDKWGRDVLAKTIKGGEASIFVGFAAALLAVLLGTVLGALAGYFGGRVNDLLEWFYNVFTSIPYILLILAFAAVLGKGLTTVIMILGITGWTGIYRLVRAEYLKHAARDYVRAAEAIGASDARRMFIHILPNISHVILIQLSQYVVQFIKAEVILSFLGFGVPVEMVSWGTMLAEAQNELVIGKWWQLTAAGAAMAVLVTAFSLLTDALRDALDPKLNA
jgi:peptide/nickel transport system permease protein